MRNILTGAAIAAAVGLSASNLFIFGIAMWKIVAATAGFALIVLGGRTRRPR
jgi:hypothetical protein